MSAVSPLAPASFPHLPAVGGVQLATYAAGIRYEGRDDLFLALLDEGTSVAGVFTKSLCPSAPVDWSRSILNSGHARAVVCNSGNANAFTGSLGAVSVDVTVDNLAAKHGIARNDIHVASTGVIGEPLPNDVLAAGLDSLNPAPSSPILWEASANAILTTDTFPKGAAASADLDGTTINVVGIAKGSGMIAPDMATMLGFVFTDAAVAPDVLQQMLVLSATASYNRITVDSDTSTSDSVWLFASGAGNSEPITSTEDARYGALAAAVHQVNLNLAHQIVRDGEGATKFVEITVGGAADDAAASVIALAIANSPLVKTALAASDANWGRIVMAVGKAGERADRDALKITIGDEIAAENGELASTYSEERATEHLQGAEVRLGIDVGIANGTATVWTCDLTHGYIEINAGYRS
ncbi:MAG: glutamate N-acetyltransferase/amino-acid N-acetyltransferase [Verrucomicrobiales bacterium]|jgi:glutamate N-acetyltransferase/amino-acid N-acetyltransferase